VNGIVLPGYRRLGAAEYLAPIPVGLRQYYSFMAAYARLGQLAKAKALLVRADAAVTDEESRYLYQVSRHRALAEVALAERRYTDALSEFRAADRRPDGPSGSCAVCLHGDLARVFDAAGQRDSAIAEFSAYHGTAGIVSGGYDGTNLAGSYKRLGELYEAKGDVKRAVEQYDKFVALWKNADPELQPVVRDVRARITRLTPVER
jgi:tetratricopeptide (TPR) repeat protein